MQLKSPPAIAALLACISISGCAFPKYVPIGDTEHLARFRVISNLEMLTQISKLDGACYKNGNDKEKLFTLPKWGATQNSIGIPIDNVPRDIIFKETEVPAGAPVAIGVTTIDTPAFFVGIFGRLLNHTACTEGISFSPRAGADYELYLSNDNGKCKLALTEIVRTKSGTIEKRPVQGIQPLPTCS